MSSVEALSCQELVELVTEYLEGSLSETDRARFEEHIGGCSGCRNYLEQMRKTIELVGGLTSNSMPPGAADALLEAFRDWKRA
jgi:predicted anti-sigma-YlaC factor YlaD